MFPFVALDIRISIFYFDSFCVLCKAWISLFQTLLHDTLPATCNRVELFEQNLLTD